MDNTFKNSSIFKENKLYSIIFRELVNYTLYHITK